VLPEAAAWTVGGKPLVYRPSAVDRERPPYDWFLRAPSAPAARIPVEMIAGPVMLVSSRTDKVWPAATYADEIAAIIKRAGKTVENLQYDDASHLLMGTGPGITRFELPGTTISFDFGGTAEGNARARAAAWAATKRFLAGL